MQLYNEDCYEGIKKIPDKSVDLVYIDPPYQYDGKMGKRLLQQNKIVQETQEQVLELSNGINESLFEELCRVMKYIRIFIWCNNEQIIDYMNYFVNKKNCDYKVLVWQKSNPMPLYAKRFLDDIEYCLFFCEKGKQKFSGIDTLENSFKVYSAPINIKDKELYKHPTIKPLQCVKNHIEKVLNGGGVCLDCFMGSGTTGVACKELGIDFIGFELDKTYYNIAVDRINGISAKDREIEATGQMRMDI